MRSTRRRSTPNPRKGGGLDAAEDERALDFLDRLGDLDAAWAGIGAVEGGAAAPHAFLVVEHLQALFEPGVAAIEDESMRGDDSGRAEVLTVRPLDGAGSGAGRAQDALGGVIESCAIFGGLQALAGGLVALGDQERQDLPVGREERLHIDDHVLLEG